MAKGPTNAELQGLLDEATKRAEEAEARVATLTADLASANERADQERAGRVEAEKRGDALGAELRDTSNSLKAYKGSATRARNEVTVLKRARSVEARPIGAMRVGTDEEAAKAYRAGIERAVGNGPVEIVFSDGKREIRELEPLLVSGTAAWWRSAQGEKLLAEPILEPGDMGKPEIRVAGFGLLDEAGRQVGWRQLPEPIVIGRNARVMIPKGSIVF